MREPDDDVLARVQRQIGALVIQVLERDAQIAQLKAELAKQIEPPKGAPV